MIPMKVAEDLRIGQGAPAQNDGRPSFPPKTLNRIAEAYRGIVFARDITYLIERAREGEYNVFSQSHDPKKNEQLQESQLDLCLHLGRNRLESLLNDPLVGADRSIVSSLKPCLTLKSSSPQLQTYERGYDALARLHLGLDFDAELGPSPESIWMRNTTLPALRLRSPTLPPTLSSVLPKMGTIPVDIRWLIHRDLPEVLFMEDMHPGIPCPIGETIRQLRKSENIGMRAEPREDGDASLGYMNYELYGAFIHIKDFTVHPGSLRRGVGSQMLGKLLGKLSALRRNRIVLVVRESNLAAQLFFRDCIGKILAMHLTNLSLQHEQGFTATETLPRYFPDTGEDGLLMQYSYLPRERSQNLPFSTIQEKEREEREMKREPEKEAIEDSKTEEQPPSLIPPNDGEWTDDESGYAGWLKGKHPDDGEDGDEGSGGRVISPRKRM